MDAPLVLPCSCTHGPHGTNPQSARHQDARYGVGMRVHTVRTGSGGEKRKRGPFGAQGPGRFCTVCGRKRDDGAKVKK